MEYVLTKRDRQLLKSAEKLIKKWRKNLQLDPLWTIGVEIIDDEEMDGAVARVDTSNSEYYVAVIEITNALLHLPEDKFLQTINELVCHELVHLVMIDFFRTAQLAAGNKDTLVKELRYKYEQFTSRFQRAFVDLDKQVIKSKESNTLVLENDGEEETS